MSLPAIIQPNVEETLAGYLATALAPHFPNAVVSNHYAGATPAVWFRQDGGQRLDVVRESVTVGVNCFADSWHDVSELARTVMALLLAAPDGHPILRVDQNVGWTSIEDKAPRLYGSVDVWVRGTDLSSA